MLIQGVRPPHFQRLAAGRQCSEKHNSSAPCKSCRNTASYPAEYYKSFSGKYKNISFTGGQIKDCRNLNTQKVSDLGCRFFELIANNSDYDIQKFLEDNIPDAVIYKSDSAKDLKQNAFACAVCRIDSDYNCTDITLLIPDLDKNASKEEKIFYSSALAHEYTHIKQFQSGKTGRLLKNMSGGSMQYAEAVNKSAHLMFNALEQNLTHELITPIAGKNAAGKNNRIIIKEKPMSKEILLSGLGVKNEKEFAELIQTYFDRLFTGLISAFKEGRSNELDLKLQAFINKILRYGLIEKLKQDVQTLCAHFAENEMEAYAAEDTAGKKMLNIKTSSNIAAYSCFYRMLADALKN